MTTKSDKTLNQLLGLDVKPQKSYMRSPGERNLLQFSPFTKIGENWLSPQGRFCRVGTKISGSNAPQKFKAIGSHELSQGCLLDSQDEESGSWVEFSEDLNSCSTESGFPQVDAEADLPITTMVSSKEKLRRIGDATLQQVSTTTTQSAEMSPKRKTSLGLSLAASKRGKETQNLEENMSRKVQMSMSRDLRQSDVLSGHAREEGRKMGTEEAVRKGHKSGNGRSSLGSRLSSLSVEGAGRKDSPEGKSEGKDEIKTFLRRLGGRGGRMRAEESEGIEGGPRLTVSHSLSDTVVRSGMGNSGVLSDGHLSGGIVGRKRMLLEGVFGRFGARRKMSMPGY